MSCGNAGTHSLFADPKFFSCKGGLVIVEAVVFPKPHIVKI